MWPSVPSMSLSRAGLIRACLPSTTTQIWRRMIAYILFFGTAFIIFWIWTKYLHVRASEWAVSDIFYFLVVAAYGVQATDGIYGVGTALFHTPYPILNSVLQMEIVWSVIMVFLVTFLQSAACGIQALIEIKVNKGE